MLKKYKFNGANIYVRSQKQSESLILKQSNTLQTLDKFKGNALMNCSYFTQSYVLGRNQGELKNDYQDKDNILDVVIFKDGTYKIDDFNSWDYINKDNIGLSFSVPCVLIENGKDVERISYAIVNNSKLTNYNPQSALFKANGVYHFLTTDGRGNTLINGYDVRLFVKQNFTNVDMLVLLDGGGSSQLIDKGKTINKLSKEGQRSMFNALAFVSGEDIAIENTEFNINTVDERFTALFAHLSEQSPLKIGDTVEYGVFIGEMGNSGYSKGTHLHLAVFETITDELPTLAEATPLSRFKPNRQECEYFQGTDLFINEGVNRKTEISCGWLGYPNHYAIDYVASGRGFKRYPLIHWNRSWIGTVVNVGYHDKYGYFVQIAYGKHKLVKKEQKQENSINTLDENKTLENELKKAKNNIAKLNSDLENKNTQLTQQTSTIERLSKIIENALKVLKGE